jgi:hypothetical protein
MTKKKKKKKHLPMAVMEPPLPWVTKVLKH